MVRERALLQCFDTQPVLRSLCRNPNGLFWAGDTAQTIAIGSSFRFNDLKAFLYRLEVCSFFLSVNSRRPLTDLFPAMQNKFHWNFLVRADHIILLYE